MKENLFICDQCGQEFAITPRELERLANHGLDMPKRCPECRRRKSKSFVDEPPRRRREKGRRSRRVH